MKEIPGALIAAFLLLSGCATQPSKEAPLISSVRAVELANASAPQAVPGRFVMEVRATDAKDNVTYLSSELDYRDQRNLGIVITPEAAQQLQEKFGMPPADALRGRRIVISGQAERVTIGYFENGIPTNNYYYQTQLRVTDAAQIEVPDNDG